MSSKLHGEIWLSAESDHTLALDQVKLLQAIENTGSISAAAKQLGISYKTAWERLNRLNNLSELPLVTRSAGGSQGGGSQLTPHGQLIVEGFYKVKQEHKDFIEKLGEKLNNVDDLASFVKSSQLVSSARNQFIGIVTAIEPGAINAEINLRISEQFSLVAIITEQSRVDLNLLLGTQVIALIKASSVMLTKNADIVVSARNKFCGDITRLALGKVNADITIDIGNEKTLNAVVTNHSAYQLGLEESRPICAFFKASSVILMKG